MNAQHDDPTDDTPDTGAPVTADAETQVLPDASVDATTPVAPPADAQRYATFEEASADILPPDPVAPATVPAQTPAPAVTLGSPRTRWAGIIWGVILAALAAITLVITLDPARRAATADWWLSLNGVTGTAYTFLALGAVAVVCAAVGLIGRAQRRRIARRAE